jgi:hypothetical protein
MVGSSSFQTAFEDVLHGSRPAWQIVGSDRQRLIAACIAWLTPERVAAHDFEDKTGGRALKILDRLLPLDKVELFRRLNTYERWLDTLYPLFRRDPGELESVTQDLFLIGERHAAGAAWVETRSSPVELLEWGHTCRQRGWAVTEDTPLATSLAATEYARVGTDLERLAASLSEAPRPDVEVLIRRLMLLVADQLPRTEDPEPGLVARLENVGLHSVARALAPELASPPASMERFLARKPRLKEYLNITASDVWEQRFASTLWEAQQTPADLDRILERIGPGETWLLVKIVPQNRADVWASLIEEHEEDAGISVALMEGLCHWCGSENRQLLERYLDTAHDDCTRLAFKRYLELVSRNEHEAMAQDRERPSWQLELLDRMLYAPHELRPRTYPASGPGGSTFDFRQLDPFDEWMPRSA